MIERLSQNYVPKAVTLFKTKVAKPVAQNTKLANSIKEKPVFELPASKLEQLKKDKFVKEFCGDDGGDWSCFPSWVC